MTDPMRQYKISRDLDERLDAKRFLAEIEMAREGHGICIDLSAVTRVNSVGVNVLLRYFHNATFRIELTYVPERFIAIFNMVSPKERHNVFVKSFFAPVVHRKTGKESHLLLEVGKDIPINRSYSDAEIDKILPQELEAAFHADEFLHFLTDS